MTVSPSSDRPFHVAVVGGGILGASTAAHLASRGTRVTLLTDGDFADGASGRSLAWLNSWGGGRSEPYHLLRTLGIERYRAFLSRVPGAASYLRFDGGLTWAAQGEESHRTAYAAMRERGYAAEWMTRDDVRDGVAGVDASTVPDEGALFSPGEGWVELGHLINHLVGVVRRYGGTVVDRAGHLEPVVVDGRAVAVASEDTRFDADHVVLALGAGVPAALAKLGTVLPDATPTAMLVRTKPVGTPLRAVLNTPRVAIRPTPDGGLVMDSSWSEAEVQAEPSGEPVVAPDVVATLLKEATTLLLGDPVLEVESLGMGPKPIPADGEPVLGAAGVDGLHVAYTHSGATLGLIAGELLADEIATGNPHPLLRPFNPSRFA